MPKPVAEWTEDDVLALPAGENDGFERKGAALLDLTIPGVKEDSVLNELAKQLSAFANTGGGQIVYGVTDSGAIENGGIARVVKGRQSTREWLEDVIPTLTDFEILGFNAHEIRPKSSGSAIGTDKALYVVEVPDSERAPHQSKRDLKYYVRLGGKSRPASHRLIEDIRNRARHPRIEVINLQLLHAFYTRSPNSSGGNVQLGLEILIRNLGTIKAGTAALLIAGSSAVNSGVSEDRELFTRPGSVSGTALIELKNSLYPGMDLIIRVPVVVQAAIVPQEHNQPEGLLLIGSKRTKDMTLTITCFADSAPPRTQEFKLADIDSQQMLIEMVRNEVRGQAW
jgi:hypothetical protein